MKYDDYIPAIKDMVERSPDPLIKAMWLRRLGVIYFEHRDLSHAQEYFTQALSVNPVMWIPLMLLLWFTIIKDRKNKA